MRNREITLITRQILKAQAMEAIWKQSGSNLEAMEAKRPQSRYAVLLLLNALPSVSRQQQTSQLRQALHKVGAGLSKAKPMEKSLVHFGDFSKTVWKSEIDLISSKSGAPSKSGHPPDTSDECAGLHWSFQFWEICMNLHQIIATWEEHLSPKGLQFLYLLMP